MSKALRVALVWRGTVIKELNVKSGPVTVGGGTAAMFHVPVDGDADLHTLFDVSNESATINVPKGMTAIVNSGKDARESGAGTVSIKSGDAGTVNLGEQVFFFQWVEDDAFIASGGILAALDWNLAGCFMVSIVLNVMGVLGGVIFYSAKVDNGEFKIPDRFVHILVDEPPGAIEDAVEEEPAVDETTSKAAGGEEGKFGEEDAEVEDSILPNHDGPMVDHLTSTELGAAFNAAIGQTGALTNVFGASDAFSNNFGADFATAGEGDVLVVGRGSGGMGMRGTGSGGGGTGFGRVGGVGDLDTGGGRGTGASLGRREGQAPRARMGRGTPSVNGFLTKEQIEKVVRRHSRGIQYCYERELANDPALNGRISANWTIGLDGAVQRASITENSMDNRNVESCVLQEIRRMRFDQPDGGVVVVTYPFTFRSEEGG